MKLTHTQMTTIGAIVLVAVSVGTTAFFFTHPFSPIYKTVSVSPKTIQETVQMSGPIVSAKNVDLSFDRSGRVTNTFVSVGQTVHAGQSLVALENTIESGQLAQAQAALQARLAGLSTSDLAVYQAAVDAALADLNKTKADTAASSTYAYQNAETILRAASSKLDDAIMVSDNILGIDNSVANDDIEKYLAISNTSKLDQAQIAYLAAKKTRDIARVSLSALSGASEPSVIASALGPAASALSDASTLLDRVSDVLAATPAVGTLTQANLDAKKSIISATRASVSAQASLLAGAIQAVTNAKNAQSDTSGASQGLIAIKQAAYDQAVANLQAKKSPPRDVDVAPLRAAVEIAQGAYEKTILRAPVDGIVARQDAKAGMIVVPGVPLVSVVNEKALQIEGRFSELDVVKTHVGDVARVTTDAYGTGVVFPATVVSFDQSASANGYKVVVQLNGADNRLKSGMQASVVVQTQTKQNALSVPSTSLTKKNGKVFVQILGADGKPVEKEVQTGIVTQDGYTEIVNGLNAGESVVTFGN